MATLHMVGRSLIGKVNVGSSPAALVVKNLPANAGNERDAGSIPGEDSLKEGMATHSSISCLDNPMNRGAWRAMAHGVTKSLT